MKDSDTDGSSQICDVWKHNLRKEMANIIAIIHDFPYVSMVRLFLFIQDTEFPGTVARPVGNFNRVTTDYTYQLLRCNVDLLKVIQLQMDAEGRYYLGSFPNIHNYVNNDFIFV